MNILAAYSPAASPTGFFYDTQNFTYNLMSGTSMACPHVAGVVGLLKTLHPDWSPSAIKSAIMTTGLSISLFPNASINFSFSLFYDVSINFSLYFFSPKIICSAKLINYCLLVVLE